jgi:hypothetical protein
VVAWGWNFVMMGNLPAIPAGLSIVQLAVGTDYGLARLSDGSLIGWGADLAGQIDVPPLPAGLTYVDVVAGQDHSLALRSDGSAVGWGYNFSGICNVPALPAGLSYVEIATGDYHSVARRSDGSVVAWGDNSAGQCDVPVLPVGVSFAEIAAKGSCTVFRIEGSPTFTSSCDPGVAGVSACPCSNPPSGPGRGCDNSSATGGAALSASGSASLANDTVVFTTQGERPTAASILIQGTSATSGVAFGQGVRCAGGLVKRLYLKAAVAGSFTAPQSGDPSVTSRSALLGDTIGAGTRRHYQVYYRDPIVLGGCPSTAGFNVTQAIDVYWSP